MDPYNSPKICPKKPKKGRSTHPFGFSEWMDSSPSAYPFLFYAMILLAVPGRQPDKMEWAKLVSGYLLACSSGSGMCITGS
jgi:hypothetical protein